jgi:hypothetical protein
MIIDITHVANPFTLCITRRLVAFVVGAAVIVAGSGTMVALHRVAFNNGAGRIIGQQPDRVFFKEGDMLWTILAVILVLWMIGLIIGIGGALIHLLLLVAGVILILRLVSGRRTVV